MTRDFTAMQDQAFAEADALIRNVEAAYSGELTDYMKSLLRDSFASGYFAGRAAALGEEIAELQHNLGLMEDWEL